MIIKDRNGFNIKAGDVFLYAGNHVKLYEKDGKLMMMWLDDSKSVKVASEFWMPEIDELMSETIIEGVDEIFC